MAPCSVAATFSARSLILASANAEDLWAMRDFCGFLVASPTEVPKPGYDYAALAGHLLQPDRPDLLAVCEDLLSQYAPGGKQGFYGACVKLADCRKMEGRLRCAGPCSTGIARRSGPWTAGMGSPGKSFQVFFDLKDLPAYPDHRRDACHGTEFLDGFYRNGISWNAATGLVE